MSAGRVVDRRPTWTIAGTRDAWHVFARLYHRWGASSTGWGMRRVEQSVRSRLSGTSGAGPLLCSFRPWDTLDFSARTWAVRRRTGSAQVVTEPEGAPVAWVDPKAVETQHREFTALSYREHQLSPNLSVARRNDLSRIIGAPGRVALRRRGVPTCSTPRRGGASSGLRCRLRVSNAPGAAAVHQRQKGAMGRLWPGVARDHGLERRVGGTRAGPRFALRVPQRTTRSARLTAQQPRRSAKLTL